MFGGTDKKVKIPGYTGYQTQHVDEFPNPRDQRREYKGNIPGKAVCVYNIRIRGLCEGCEEREHDRTDLCKVERALTG